MIILLILRICSTGIFLTSDNRIYQNPFNFNLFSAYCSLRIVLPVPNNDGYMTVTSLIRSAMHCAEKENVICVRFKSKFVHGSCLGNDYTTKCIRIILWSCPSCCQFLQQSYQPLIGYLRFKLY